MKCLIDAAPGDWIMVTDENGVLYATEIIDYQCIEVDGKDEGSGFKTYRFSGSTREYQHDRIVHSENLFSVIVYPMTHHIRDNRMLLFIYDGYDDMVSYYKNNDQDARLDLNDENNVSLLRDMEEIHRKKMKKKTDKMDEHLKSVLNTLGDDERARLRELLKD